MSRLKSLPLALTVLGLGATASFSEIKISDNLSTAGFIDMSISGAKKDSVDATLDAKFDQFELDFMYKYGNVSARVDLNKFKNNSVDFEQGFVNYSMGTASITAGRFLSAMGFEAAEPTGLFQYSASKTTVDIYGGYQNGLNVNYSTPMFSLYGAVVSDLWNSNETDLITPGFEGQLALMPIEGITVKAGYLFQVVDTATTQKDQQLGNIWAQYAKGPLTLAAEYNLLMNWQKKGQNGSGWLVVGNMKFAEFYAATVRYSGLVLGDADASTEITFSPSVQLAPNWLALAEIRQDIQDKVTSYAIENTLSF